MGWMVMPQLILSQEDTATARRMGEGRVLGQKAWVPDESHLYINKQPTHSANQGGDEMADWLLLWVKRCCCCSGLQAKQPRKNTRAQPFFSSSYSSSSSVQCRMDGQLDMEPCPWNKSLYRCREQVKLHLVLDRTCGEWFPATSSTGEIVNSTVQQWRTC